jgi:hypothetical protein
MAPFPVALAPHAFSSSPATMHCKHGHCNNPEVSKINWKSGGPEQLNVRGLDWSAAELHLYPLSKRATVGAPQNDIDAADDKEYSGFFYEGYEDILSKPYPTKGVKSYDDLLDKEALRSAIAAGARVNSKEVEEILGPAREQLDKLEDPYEKDSIMNMIWDTISEGLFLGDVDKAIRAEQIAHGGTMTPIPEETTEELRADLEIYNEQELERYSVQVELGVE